MKTEVTDEMLMAYVDGELDGETARTIARALESDPELAQRADDFTRSAQAVRLAFGTTLEEEPPSRLVDSIEKAPDGRVVRFPRRLPERASLPLAASIALAVGLAGGLWLDQFSGGNPSGLPAESAIAEALASLPSGQTTTVGPSGAQSLMVAGSYPTESGLCRTFEVQTGEAVWSGVGCERDGAYRIDMLVASGGEGGFSVASDRVSQAIAGYLQSVGASAPLGLDEEAERLRGE